MNNTYTLADGRTICFENIDSVSEVKSSDIKSSFEVMTVTGNVYVVETRSGRMGLLGISHSDVYKDRRTLVEKWNEFLESEK